MTTKSLLSAAVLTLATFTVASAKSYDITIDNAAKAGTASLKPGQYTVKVEKNMAVFTASDGKTYTAPVKLDNSASKHGVTSVTMANEKGTEVVKSISLGGSHTTLEFND